VLGHHAAGRGAAGDIHQLLHTGDRTEGALLEPAEADRGLFGSSAIHWQVLVRPRQNKQSNTIAHELDISVGGVETHIRRVLTNLGARDRAESAFVAVRIGQSWLTGNPRATNPATFDFRPGHSSKS